MIVVKCDVDCCCREELLRVREERFLSHPAKHSQVQYLDVPLIIKSAEANIFGIDLIV